MIDHPQNARSYDDEKPSNCCPQNRSTVAMDFLKIKYSVSFVNCINSEIGGGWQISMYLPFGLLPLNLHI